SPVEITVSYFKNFKRLLIDVYGMNPILEKENVTLFDVGEGGNGGQVILRNDDSAPSQHVYGQVHHVSFRVKDQDAIKEWEAKYDEVGMGHSGNVDRFYFEALYTRVGHILIEVSTDGPGFMDDEPYETLGESLALPPFLEPKRE